eukprot:scaffold23644_cov56-Phaeocystis_antarctica.AAC.2
MDHRRLIWLGPAGPLVEVHAEVARLVLGHAQRQTLRLCLLPRLLARQRCSPLLRRRLPLRRTRNAQRRLLGGSEAAQAHLLATARHLRLIGLGIAGIGEVHAEIARLVLGHEQPPPRLSAALPLQPAPPLPPAPPVSARRTAPPPRRWRSCPGAPCCHHASPAPGRAWAGGAGGGRQSNPSCYRPPAASAPPPAPAAAPPRSTSTAVAGTFW